MSAQTFGTTALTTAAIDQKILDGWGVRSNDWQFGVSIQQQVLPRVSIEAGYFRRWLNNFTVTDNLAVRRGRFHGLQHHGAIRPAAARRRQLRRERPVQRRAEQVRPDQQQHHAGE